MKAQIHTTIRRLSLFTGLLACMASLAGAATVSINQNAEAVAGGSLVAGARLRASNNSWDMGLSNGRRYESPNVQRSNLANRFTLPGREFSFALEHRAGEGFVFTVEDSRTGRVTTQAWGTFSETLDSRNVVPTLGGLAPVAAFDALQIEARATLSRSRTTFSDLVFTAPDLAAADGDFYSGSLVKRTAIGNGPRGTATQDLLADVNLASYSWTLSGVVSFTRGAGREGADDVSLSINLRNVGASSAVPEPAGAALLIAALGCTLARRRRVA